MVSCSDENIKCKYCNSISRLYDPVCSGIDQDKPFGSEMCYGRGLCDTDPIPKYKIKKSCRIKDDKFVNTVTTSIDDVALNRYFKNGQQPLKPEQQDLKREKDIEKQFLQDLLTDILSLGFGTLQDTSLNQDLGKHFYEKNEQESKGKLVNHCNRNSSGSRRSDIPNASNVTMHSSTIRDYFFENSETPYEKPLKKKLKNKYIKLAGPFTEPFNPGKQMKLGEPDYVRYCVEKDFYKDF